MIFDEHYIVDFKIFVSEVLEKILDCDARIASVFISQGRGEYVVDCGTEKFDREAVGCLGLFIEFHSLVVVGVNRDNVLR